MRLSSEQVEKFYAIWKPLLLFVNRRLRLVPEMLADDFDGPWGPQEVIKLRDALWADDSLLEDFVAENPAKLAATLAAGLPGAGLAAATAIHAACELGGVPVAIPEALAEAVRTAKSDFLDNDLLSKPLGVYTWTPELSAIFRQDRFLQQSLDPDTADGLARAVAQTPGASDARDAWLRLNARLTNPPKKLSIWDIGKSPPFFPASRSHEVALFESLFESLFEDRPIPEGFDLMAELIRRIRSGEIDLEPTELSGWYDHQTWSLEPLVVLDRMPERARLELGKRYRKHLEDLFRGALALARETHVKQAGYGGAGRFREPPIWVGPGLTVEPLPSLYARRAACYRFVGLVLEEAFGAGALHRLQRLTVDVGPSLREELLWIEKLFAGAAATASRELGLEPPDDMDEFARCFAEWRAALKTDQDVSRDARMMVPVFYDVLREKTKVWAFLGWRATQVNAHYQRPPQVLGVEPLHPSREPLGGPPPVLFSGDHYEFAVPVMAEVYVTKLLDRDEFRRHCDRYQTREAILANLQ